MPKAASKKSTSSSGLATVQSLYVVQLELTELVEGGLRSADDIKEAKKQLRKFSQLLKDADWRYMGGEDVYESLQKIRDDVAKRVKTKSGSKKAPAKRKANVAGVRAKPSKATTKTKSGVRARRAVPGTKSRKEAPKKKVAKATTKKVSAKKTSKR